jgi:arylformamidase
MKPIDITMPLRHGMAHYPDDPAIEFQTVLDIRNGATVNLKRYSFGSHSGTHVDAPYHFYPNGKKADELPVDFFIGTAKVFSFHSDIRAEDLAELDIQADDIVLFKTHSRSYIAEYNPNHACVLPCAAQCLVDTHVRAVGVDCLSIETDETFPTHRILLGAGIPIIEGLHLCEAEPGIYRMTAMLMRIEDSDGAPIRAMLEKYE